jgi:hypothetical protein
VVQALRHKAGSPGFDSRWGPWKFASALSALSILGVHLDHNRNEYQELLLG